MTVRVLILAMIKECQGTSIRFARRGGSRVDNGRGQSVNSGSSTPSDIENIEIIPVSLSTTRACKLPTVDGRFYPTIAGILDCVVGILRSLLPQGFPLKCEASKSSIEILQEEVMLGRIWIQFNNHKRIRIKVVSERPPIEGQIDIHGNGFNAYGRNNYGNGHFIYRRHVGVGIKLFLELYASYVTLDGNMMVNPLTCDLTFDIDHMLKCSSPCAYLKKQLLVNVARIKLSYHDLEWLHDNLFFDFLLINFSSSCASMWKKKRLVLDLGVGLGFLDSDDVLSETPLSLTPC
ncbi:hypothetical protein M9H77_17210 [Catharanthus roseus]|uniref:Uncharacterized protein n=1 Tax=Catharanthus roseus TaxID=4058 RepID=A0ACC0B464_CATRO|nr:hypothetical protein M9H77_17210 [Catharanthus roseus]